MATTTAPSAAPVIAAPATDRPATDRPATDRPAVRAGAPRFHRWLIGLELFLGASAVGGAIAMLLDPEGFMPTRWLDGTGLDSWVVPGIALLVLNGLMPLVAAFMEVRRDWQAPLAHMVVGGTLMVWIAMQVMVVPFSWLQPTMFAVGAAIFSLGTMREAHRLRVGRHPSSLRR